MNREKFVKLLISGQKEFKNIDIEGNFINEDLSNLVFENCFIVADFTGANLEKTVFMNCNLKASIFKYANLERSTFNCNALDAADFSFVQYNQITFKDNSSYGNIFTKEILEEIAFEQLLGFHIEKVHAGWFEVMLVGKRIISIITASNYLGNDAPKEFLQALCELCENIEDKVYMERWLCWDEEPGAYIWKIVRDNEKIIITVNTAKQDSYNIKLHDRKSLENEEIYCTDIIVEGQFYFFCKEVIKSFEKIRKINGKQHYEKNWGKFPEIELERLKKVIVISKN